jgi:hypothetical protein
MSIAQNPVFHNVEMRIYFPPDYHTLAVLNQFTEKKLLLRIGARGCRSRPHQRVRAHDRFRTSGIILLDQQGLGHALNGTARRVAAQSLAADCQYRPCWNLLVRAFQMAFSISASR